MRLHALGSRAFLASLMAFVLSGAMPVPDVRAAEWPAPGEGEWIARDFRFHDGSVLPELRLHYTTLGERTHPAVLVLHGTAGSGAALLTPEFAGQLFGPGQVLDASRYFIILPDGIGAGKSSKPSDGLRTRFPSYDYADMVQAQHRLIEEGLGIHHLRLVLGYSMGGMHTWLWAGTYPDFMDALVPMAAQPAAMSGRNWMLRRLVIDSIRRDPDWQGGNYERQPQAWQFANAFFLIATSGGAQAYARMAPSRAAADRYVDERLAAPLKVDTNDYLFQWEASADYDPTPLLGRIRAPLLAINSADDERNPPELGVIDAAIARIPGASLHSVPGGPDTRGHGTVLMAARWSARLQDFLSHLAAPPRP